MASKMQKFVLIDGNALVHRGFHAIPPSMKTKDGILTNGVYGFTTMLLNVFTKIKPEYIAVTFDKAKPTFRHELYKEYKAQRVKAPQELYDQIPLVKKVVRAFNIPIFEKDGFEADDLLGTLSLEITKKCSSAEVIIVTGDSDTLQLINDRVKVFTLKKGFSDTVLYDEAMIKEKFGLVPLQLIDMKSFAGDQSDNIPGVKGIGKKGAEELIKKFGTLEKVFEAFEKEDLRLEKRYAKKLEGAKESALFSKKLVTIKKDVPVIFDMEKCKMKDFSAEEVREIFKELGFRSLMDRVPKSDNEEKIENKQQQTNSSYKTVFKESELKNIAEEIKKRGEFVFDTETTSINPMNAKLVGFSVCLEPKKAFYIPLRHVFYENPDISSALQKENLIATENQLGSDIVFKYFKPIFEDKKIKKIGHNLKYDMIVMENEGITFDGEIFDTMLASYVLDPGNRSHGLDKLAFREFGYEMLAIDSLIGKGKNEITFDKVPIERATFYCCEDSDFTMRLYSVLSGQIEKISKEQKQSKFGKTRYDLEFVLNKLELPLVRSLVEMEKAGVALDTVFISDFGKVVEKEIKELEKKIYFQGGKEFNINSTQQLKEILFKKLKLSTSNLKTTKTGISTAAGELEKLRGKHQIVEYVLRYRELNKLKNTYIDALPLLVNKKTKRLHTTFNQTVTATGRLSSSDPNLQNIPIRTPEGKKLRRAFVANKGFKLLSLDYSQIDLRVMAHYSEDPGLIDAFKRTKDIHSETAAKIFGVKVSQVIPGMRRVAKTVNFGVLYGMSPFGLSESLSISREKAKHYIETYFKKYARVKDYVEKVLDFAKKNEYVETMFGRRRYLPEINASNFIVRSGAERMAINMPIQGTSADIIKYAMVDVQKLVQEKWAKHAKMILQVHDELVFEVRENRVKEFAKEVKKIMEEVVKINVPINVDAEIGDNWEELEELSI